MQSFNVTATSVVLTNLTPGTLYRITVVAINGAGRGAESAPLEAMTLNGNATTTHRHGIFVYNILTSLFLVPCLV